ncbi:MAG: hypothetical protein ACERKZ_12840 [Lachnotalea sp.]
MCLNFLASVVSDTFGVSASALIDYILNCDSFDPEFAKTLLRKKLKDKSDEVMQSIIGYELRGDQSTKMKVCRKQYAKHREQYIKNAMKLLEREGCTIIPPTVSA